MKKRKQRNHYDLVLDASYDVDRDTVILSAPSSRCGIELELEEDELECVETEQNEFFYAHDEEPSSECLASSQDERPEDEYEDELECAETEPTELVYAHDAENPSESLALSQDERREDEPNENTDHSFHSSDEEAENTALLLLNLKAHRDEKFFRDNKLHTFFAEKQNKQKAPLKDQRHHPRSKGH